MQNLVGGKITCTPDLNEKSITPEFSKVIATCVITLFYMWMVGIKETKIYRLGCREDKIVLTFEGVIFLHCCQGK